MRNPRKEPDYEKLVNTPFADDRLDVFCCFCGCDRRYQGTTKDHVPSIGLFDGETPALLPTVRVCKSCNREHSIAEQYAYCAISAALSGSPRPVEQRFKIGRRVLENDKRLRRIISNSFIKGEDGRSFFRYDAALIGAFLEKQARGHVFLENSETLIQEPSWRFISTVQSATEEQTRAFFGRQSDVYPEIGSRGFVRMLEGSEDLDGFKLDTFGFIVIQSGTYRFRVVCVDGAIVVQSVIHEYLLTEVAW